MGASWPCWECCASGWRPVPRRAPTSAGERPGCRGEWDTAVANFREALQEHPDRTDYKGALAAGDEHRVAGTSRRPPATPTRRATSSSRSSSTGRSTSTTRPIATRCCGRPRSTRNCASAPRPRGPVRPSRRCARRRASDRRRRCSIRRRATRSRSSSRQASSQDILTFIGKATGINVIFESTFRPAQITVDLTGLSLEEGLTQVMTAAGTFYKVMNPRTIQVIPDTPPKRAAYEEQVIRTFYLSHADADRTGADGAADPAVARPAGAAARAGQQDAEQPHGARVRPGDEHHRPGRPQQRQAARRDRRRRRDHRGEPRPGQGSGPEPVAVLRWGPSSRRRRRRPPRAPSRRST